MVDDEPLAAFADVPHLLKAMRNALLNHGELRIHPEFVTSANLTTDVVSLEVIVRLLKFKAEREGSIAPHLTEKSLDLGHFGKMKVNPARALLSRETAVAIKFVVAHYPEFFSQDDLTTAFFCDMVGEW